MARVIVFLGVGMMAAFLFVLLIATLFEAAARVRDVQAHPPPGRFVRVDGLRLHVRCIGKGGPTVVMVSGGGTPSAMSYPLQDRIGAFTRVCSYDRPGLGWSDAAARGKSFEGRARELDALLAAVGEPGPYVLVAESYGGLLARAYARLRPDAVVGMVLVDSAEEQHVFNVLPRMERGLGQLRLYSVLGRLGALRWLLVHRPELAGLPPGLPVTERRRLAALISRPEFAEAARQDVEAYRVIPAKERVAGGFGWLGDKPLVVIRHGRPFTGGNAWMESGWTEAQVRLAALSTSSRLIVAERSDHAIAQTSPDLVAMAVRGIVANLRILP